MNKYQFSVNTINENEPNLLLLIDSDNFESAKIESEIKGRKLCDGKHFHFDNTELIAVTKIR